MPLRALNVLTAAVAVLNAHEDGYDVRGTRVHYGTALVNGLVVFGMAAIACRPLALALARGRRSRRETERGV